MLRRAFWIQLRGGVSVATASRAVGVSQFTGYRWLAEAGGPAALGLERRLGRPWGGRTSEQIREVFWAELRRGVTLRAAARAAGVSRRTGRAWLIEGGGVRPRVSNPDLEVVVDPGAGVLSFTDRCRIEDLVKAGYTPARIAALLGRHRSTITCELVRGRPEGPGRYRAVRSQGRLERNRGRAGPAAEAGAGHSGVR